MQYLELTARAQQHYRQYQAIKSRPHIQITNSTYRKIAWVIGTATLQNLYGIAKSNKPAVNNVLAQSMSQTDEEITTYSVANSVHMVAQAIAENHGLGRLPTPNAANYRSELELYNFAIFCYSSTRDVLIKYAKQLLGLEAALPPLQRARQIDLNHVLVESSFEAFHLTKTIRKQLLRLGSKQEESATLESILAFSA